MRFALLATIFVVVLIGIGVGVAALEADGTIEDPEQLVCDWATRGGCDG